MGGCPEIVVMGWDLQSEGRGFESQNFFLMDIVQTNLFQKLYWSFVWKRPKNDKEAGMAHFYMQSMYVI